MGNKKLKMTSEDVKVENEKSTKTKLFELAKYVIKIWGGWICIIVLGMVYSGLAFHFEWHMPESFIVGLVEILIGFIGGLTTQLVSMILKHKGK